MQPEQNEPQNEGGKSRNIFQKTGDAVKGGVKSLKERTQSAMLMGQEEMQRALIQQAMPMIKKAIPGIEEKLKNYLSGVDDLEKETGEPIEKLALIKRRKDGSLEIVVLAKEHVEINVLSEKGLLHQFNLDSYVNQFMAGGFDAAATTQD